MVEDADDPLEALWQRAANDPLAEEAFLRELSCHAVLTVLMQPPGPGESEPSKNLALWKHQVTGDVFVPIYTHSTRLTFKLPPPATTVRVAMRALLAAGGERRYIVNPLSESPFVLDAVRLTRIRTYFDAQGLDPSEPSRQFPWAFRFPDDALYPVALALVAWFNASGRVDEAYMYELSRGNSSPVVVLGLNHKLDPGLAAELKAVAVGAGAAPDTFEVRFIQDEPSHRAGIEGIHLTPFYRWPKGLRR